MMLASGWAAAVTTLTASSTSPRPMSAGAKMLMITPRAPLMVVSISGAVDGLEHGFGHLVASGAVSHAHVGVAGILHDGGDVCKVEVDVSGAR